MRQKGQATTIMAALIIGAVVVAGLYIVMPKVSGKSGPEIPGVTHKTVKADLKVKVSTRKWRWETASVDIQDESITTYTVNQIMAYDPMDYWFKTDTFKGEVVVKSIKDGKKVDEASKNVQISEDVFQTKHGKKYPLTLELGKPDDGQITIKATLYNNKGTEVGSDSVKTTI